MSDIQPAYAEYQTWLVADASPMFAIHANDSVITARTKGMQLVERTTAEANGRTLTQYQFQAESPDLEIINHVATYADTKLFEQWQTITNRGNQPIQITRLDSIALLLAPAAYEVFAYTSDWGSEFTPIRVPIANMPLIQSRSGRSSKGNMPWFALFRPDGAILSSTLR